MSLAFGVAGLVLLAVGFLAGSDPVLIGGTSAGALSLVAALWWRSQLIASWRQRPGRSVR